MAVQLKDKKFGTLVLIVLFGVIAGALMSELIKLIPVGDNVFKTFFTHPLEFGLDNIAVNLIALKFHFGIKFQFTLMSIIGVFLSLYFFRWYK